MLELLTLIALVAPPSAPAVAGPKAITVLAKEPKLDGDLKDLAPAPDFKGTGASAEVALKAAFRKDTLYLGLTVKDDAAQPGDHLDLTLYFPDSGTTSQGVVYRFGRGGVEEAPLEVAAPEWAQGLVKSAVHEEGKGFTLEVMIPARALPRFQASKPLLVSLCAEYSDVDQAGGEASLASTCPSGEMPQGPLRLPDEFRKSLKLLPSAEVEGIEARATGWVGFSRLHSACWAQGDTALTAQSLSELVLGEAAIVPSTVALPIPDRLMLPDNTPIYTLLTGRNPFAGKGGCVSSNELRLVMYAVKGTVATRVLEWPAANCRLGRAMQFELSPEGNLAIGYTEGGTARFTWLGDHFERSELGLR